MKTQDIRSSARPGETWSETQRRVRQLKRLKAFKAAEVRARTAQQQTVYGVDDAVELLSKISTTRGQLGAAIGAGDTERAEFLKDALQLLIRRDASLYPQLYNKGNK